MDHVPFVGLSHLELNVSDLDASTAWYATAVGLKHLRTEPGRYAILQPDAGGFNVVLRPGRVGDAHGELGHVAFAVESLGTLTEWAEHLTETGVPHQGIKAETGVPNQGNKGTAPEYYSLELFDPDGHEIELIFGEVV